MDPAVIAAAEQSIQESGGIENQVMIEAELALMGQHPTPEQAIQVFVQMFGEEALQSLVAKVTKQMHAQEAPPQPPQGPANTDSVPAMLTPGEFVLPKEAVDQIGVDNLNKIAASSTGEPPQNSNMSPEEARSLVKRSPEKRGILPRAA